MRGLAVAAFACVVGCACLFGYQQHRIRRLTGERDRLAADLAGAREGVNRLFLADARRRAEMEAALRQPDAAPGRVRGPCLDGQGIAAVTGGSPVRVFEVLGGTMVPGLDPALAGPLVRGLPQPPAAGAEQARRFYP